VAVGAVGAVGAAVVAVFAVLHDQHNGLREVVLTTTEHVHLTTTYFAGFARRGAAQSKTTGSGPALRHCAQILTKFTEGGGG
jgi:hypothetical protein